MPQRLYVVESLNGSATVLTDFLSEVNFLHCSKLDVLLLAAKIFLIHKWNCHKQIQEQTQLPLGKKTFTLVGTNVLTLVSNPLVANFKVVISISKCVSQKERNRELCFLW